MANSVCGSPYNSCKIAIKFCEGIFICRGRIQVVVLDCTKGSGLLRIDANLASRALLSSDFRIKYLISRFAPITSTYLILNNLSANWENQCHRFWFGCPVSRTSMGIAAAIRSLLVLFIKVGQENHNTGEIDQALILDFGFNS